MKNNKIFSKHASNFCQAALFLLLSGLLLWAMPARAKAYQPPQHDLRFGKDSLECARNWSMYDEYVKHRTLQFAYTPWRYVFDNCPLATINIYVHGVNIVRYQYDHETDEAKKQEWLDLLMRVFDQRIEYFGNEGFVLGRKAVTLFQMQPGEVEKIFELTQRSIELMGESSEAAVLQINFLASAQKLEAGTMELDTLFLVFERAIDIIDENLERGNDKALYEAAKTTILALFRPYGNCETLVRLYKPRFDATPDDLYLLRQITGMLESSGCNDSELYYLAIRQRQALAPDAETAFMLGRMENSHGNFVEAIRYFRDAAVHFQLEDPEGRQEEIFRSYWFMAEISFRQLRQLPQAREFARQAHTTNPADGRPLILMGEMYASSAAECGTDEFTRKAAFWAAADKFQQAAGVAADLAVKERALQMAETYRQYFPNGEEIFFNGFTQGETYRIECWINETTTIRAK